MNAQLSDTTPLRTGMRRLIPLREFRHLRAVGRARIGAGIFLLVCGGLAASAGGYGWAALFFVIATALIAVGYWQVRIARSTPPRA
jgi:hypothetical protein